MWGDNPSVQSRKYLRQAIWQLQAALKQEGLLVVDSDWIGVDKSVDVWIDVDEFERAFADVQGIPGNLGNLGGLSEQTGAKRRGERCLVRAY